MAIHNEIFAHYRTEKDRLQQAIEILRKNGYYTENLWHIDDVKQNYDITDEQAYEVLDKAMTLDYTTSTIFEVVDEVCSGNDHKKKVYNGE